MTTVVAQVFQNGRTVGWLQCGLAHKSENECTFEFGTMTSGRTSRDRTALATLFILQAQDSQAVRR